MAANHVRPSRPSSTGPAHSSTKPLSDRWIRPAWRNGADIMGYHSPLPATRVRFDPPIAARVRTLGCSNPVAGSSPKATSQQKTAANAASSPKVSHGEPAGFSPAPASSILPLPRQTRAMNGRVAKATEMLTSGHGACSTVPAPYPSLSSSASEGGSEGHGGTNAVTKPRRLGHLCPPHDPVRYVLCGTRSHYLATKP